jgi:hypothetical protein
MSFFAAARTGTKSASAWSTVYLPPRNQYVGVDPAGSAASRSATGRSNRDASPRIVVWFVSMSSPQNSLTCPFDQ